MKLPAPYSPAATALSSQTGLRTCWSQSAQQVATGKLHLPARRALTCSQAGRENTGLAGLTWLSLSDRSAQVRSASPDCTAPIRPEVSGTRLHGQLEGKEGLDPTLHFPGHCPGQFPSLPSARENKPISSDFPSSGTDTTGHSLGLGYALQHGTGGQLPRGEQDSMLCRAPPSAQEIGTTQVDFTGRDIDRGPL